MDSHMGLLCTPAKKHAQTAIEVCSPHKQHATPLWSLVVWERGIPAKEDGILIRCHCMSRVKLMPVSCLLACHTQSYMLCPTFGQNTLFNLVADMMAGTVVTPSSRDLSGCFAVCMGQGEKAASLVADTMLTALRTAVLMHFAKAPSLTASGNYDEAASACAGLCCIVMMRATVATQHVGDALSYQAFCFGCESSPSELKGEFDNLRQNSRGDRFGIQDTPSGPDALNSAQR